MSGVAVTQFQEAGFEVEALKGALEEKELVGKVRGASILGVRSKTRITPAVLDAAPELVAVGAFCIGVDKIDRTASSERGIAVFNDPHSNSRSVAELTLGEIILLLRRAFEASSQMHRGEWNKSAAGAHEVRGLTLGIVGYGKIGSQVSDLAEAMGMRVIFHDISHVLARGNARPVGFRELLETSDVITLHIDGKPQNRDFFGEDEFRQMKDGACLINLSRGFVVDHAALAKQNIGQFVSARMLEYLRTGNSLLSVNLPHCHLEYEPGSHRLMHIHHNLPGILRAINDILADRGINIERQVLDTQGNLGYAIYDMNRPCDADLMRQLRAVPQTIRVRSAGECRG